MPNLRHTKRVIVSYVTAGARIHLYGFVDRLLENAIYCYKYSVIFIQPRGEPYPIATGKGGWTCIRNWKPQNAAEFVSVGSKNYAYRVIANERDKPVCKFRGITLNCHASQLDNFEVKNAMILVQGITLVKIKRKRKAGGTVALVTEPEDKSYRISFFYRRRMQDNSSDRFGYKWWWVPVERTESQPGPACVTI